MLAGGTIAMSSSTCPFCELPRVANAPRCAGCAADLGRPGAATWTIGADPACELVVADRRVSGRHARLWYQAGRFTVEDLGSTNGVWVDGARLTAATVVHRESGVTLGREVALPWPRLAHAAAAPAPSARGPGAATMMRELHVEVGRLQVESRAHREALHQAGRRRWLVPAVIALAVAGLGAGAVAIALDRPATPPPPPAPVVVAPPVAPPVVPPPLGLDAIRKRIYADNHRAIVLIQHRYTAGGRTVEIEGTGFCIDGSGLIVTNRHVAKPWTEDHLRGRTLELQVFFAGEENGIAGTVLRDHPDPEIDLALITVGGSGHPAVVGLDPDPDPVQVGDEAVIIGFPLGSDLPFEAGATPSLTAGVISKKLTKLFQYDATSHHGSSGSPVFATDGKVIAVNFAGASGSGGGSDIAAGINYGIPVRYVLELLPH